MTDKNYIQKKCSVGDTLCRIPLELRGRQYVLTYLGQDGTSFYIRAMMLDDQNRVIGQPMKLIYKNPPEKDNITFSFQDTSFIAQTATNSFLKCYVPSFLVKQKPDEE